MLSYRAVVADDPVYVLLTHSTTLAD
eukprot:COSAG06_NODE_44502_length_363_cov_0.568182_1_plen_25_part_10